MAGAPCVVGGGVTHVYAVFDGQVAVQFGVKAAKAFPEFSFVLGGDIRVVTVNGLLPAELVEGRTGNLSFLLNTAERRLLLDIP